MIDDNEMQRVSLNLEIENLQQQIINTRDAMYRYYTLKRKTELLELPDNEVPPSTIPDVDLDLHFYKNILDVKPEDDDSGFTISFPFKGKTTHGLKLKLVELDKYSVGKMYLPPSLNVQDVQQKLVKTELKKVVLYIRELQENIYAYYIREEHVNKLKEIMSPSIMLYHSQNYTELQLIFEVFNIQTNVRKSVVLQINYDLYSVQPNKINCKVNFDDDSVDSSGDGLQELLNQHFQEMATKDLVSGYEAVFKDFQDYKFFV